MGTVMYKLNNHETSLHKRFVLKCQLPWSRHFQVVLFKAMFDLIADLHLEPLGIHGSTREGILKFYEVLILIYIANV